MNNGIYAASTGLLARTQELDLAANNLANANTSGFRGERVSFKTQMMSASANASTRAVNSFGVLGSPRTDFSQGSMQQTGNSLDVALEGSGYLAVQSPTGIQYTRNGNFHLTKTGALATAQGFPVLGDKGPITLPQGEVEISSSGVISVDGDVAAQLKLTDFDSSVPLTSMGEAYYSAPLAAATPATQLTVRQGALESSNINPVESAVGLIEIQRNAEMMQRALSTFHTEFNRIAAEDLPKV
ncbi:MAG TPA: flagellar basal-body rod protein FlgF [Candidatus Saccharimonadales bacterium]|nr:flagellar basal-body rod protein FlgF [Candidatus Saccharimonadales bacterium]